MSVRNLEKVRQMLLAVTELDIAYAYDDLVIGQHGVLIFQFSEKNPMQLELFFNEDCWPEKVVEWGDGLIKEFKSNGYTLVKSGRFTMDSKDEKGEIDLKFIKN